MITWEEFARWWVTLEPGFIRTARRYGLSNEEASDVVQDVAVLAIRNQGQFDNVQDFRNWAFARLHWLLLDEIRHRRNRPTESLAGSVEPSIPPAQEHDFIVNELRRLIDQLPKQQRAALVGMLDGRSPAAIAQELNVKEATVRSLQRFGRQKLVSLLTEKEATL